MTMHSANRVYKSYIIPVLDYCDTVWNCCGSVNSDKLERLQRQAARIIMKSDRSETALKYLRREACSVFSKKNVSARNAHTFLLIISNLIGMF